MRKKSKITIIITIIMLICFSGCKENNQEKNIGYEKYDYVFLDTFDTVTQIIAYAKSKEEFDGYAEKFHNRMIQLHKLYDKYNNYEGINNIKTINDNAGIKAVKVDKDIIDLIVFSKNMYQNISDKTNIAMGSVLEVWAEYRDIAELDPKRASIPPLEKLMEASKYTNMDNIIIDEENSTVFLNDKNMSLDVGSVAKGYATEIALEEIRNEGLTSVIVSAGGNIKTLDKPLDGLRERWGVGIQDPDNLYKTVEESILETIYVNNKSVVTSGDYQRYYLVDDKIMHHIIDEETLMPGDYFRSVTVVTPNSGEADYLSTSVFLLPYEEGLKLVNSLEDVEAMWVFKDGDIKVTEGLKKIMRSEGVSAANK